MSSAPGIYGGYATKGRSPSRGLQDWDSKLEHEILRSGCRDHFRSFFKIAWGMDYGPHRDSWVIKRNPLWEELADWYQDRVRAWLADRATGRGKVHHLAVVVSRDLGKTTLITQAGQMWLHLQEPDLSTYTGSEKTEFAVDILKGMLPVVTGADPYARFAEFYGNWVHPDRTWKDQQIVHAMRKNVARKEPSFGTWGVESGLTGKHPDALFLDDPTSYEKMASHQNWLETVNNHCTSLIPVVKEDGLVVYVGTRYHDGDHFGHAFQKEGVRSMAGMPIPDIECRPDGKWHVFFMAGRDRFGKPTVPQVWSDERMKDYERKDPNRYAAQVMNDPTSSEFNPLTMEQINQLWVDDKDVAYGTLRYTVHCDTAFKNPERQGKGDESVFQVWGHTRDGSGDVYFIEGHGSSLWRGEDFYMKLISVLQKMRRINRRVVLLTDETPPGKTGAGELLLQSFCHGAGIPAPPYMEFHRGGKRKDERVRAAASFWVDGHVRLIRSAPGVDRLTGQMSRIGFSLHDDWSDPAADVFHKDVYFPMHRMGNAQRPAWLPAPQDDVLKDGSLREEQLYDQHHTREAMGWEREPVT